MGSTYIGGTANDGLNTVVALEYNYGDAFRGEITVDNSGNCYVASTTNSSNFPVTNGSSSAGGSEGVSFKFNASLTSLLWSTYIGGTSNDAAYGVQLDASNNIFITGGTQSNNLTGSSNAHNGGVDGYLQKYNPAGTLLASRYIGTASYDQTYLVQVDINDDIYVVGQSTGPIPVSPGKYNNANSGQFIQKYNNNLSALTYSTVVGRGSGAIDISPSAFLVNDCGLIYLSGWGGQSNKPASSTTTGLPITGNAFQSTTDGSDFYLMVLDKDATGLLYATFFGGSSSAEHVDGGTSRFDKDGNVYQAVCAGCGGNSDFPTNSGAYSQTNNSTNCNLAVFKFNVDVIFALASTPQATYCWPNPVSFTNASSGGNTYFWDFGDGTTSTQFSPTHSYPSSGTYTVKLVVSDSTGCILPDSSTITIQLYNPVNLTVTPDTGICPNTALQLNVSGAASYVWSPSATLSNSTSANPIASPNTNTTYTVIGTDVCGADTAQVNVIIHPINTFAGNDTIICAGGSANLWANGGASYTWSPAITTNPSNTANTVATPTSTTTYTVNITTNEGCPSTESVTVEVDNGLSIPVLTNDTGMCNGETMLLQASGARNYVWSPTTNLFFINDSTVNASPSNITTYAVDFSNACGTVRESVEVAIQKPTAVASPSDTICFNDTFLLWADGGVAYQWQPNGNLASPSNDSTIGLPAPEREYLVIVTDALGCRDTAYTTIYHFPRPFVDAGEDQIINFGEEVMLNPDHSDGSFFWTNSPYLSCHACKYPTAMPATTTTFTANLIDQYGCKVTDDVTISVDGVLFIPNSFTPNGDGFNDLFKAVGQDLTEFELLIFNRWGQLIYESTDINESWDGTYKGLQAPIDTYVWKVVYSDVNTFDQSAIGHVNLIR